MEPSTLHKAFDYNQDPLPRPVEGREPAGPALEFRA